MSKSRTKKKAPTAKKPQRKGKKKDPAAELIVESGDFILIDFTGRIHDDQQLFDTTKEAVAREAGTFSEEEQYQPRLIILGLGWLVPGLDENLIGMKVGETKQVTLEPEKAFGNRDPKQVRIIPKGRIKTDKKLVRGMRIRLGNQSGTIRHVGGGRVTIDFNPPLAGRTVDYEVTITTKLTKAKEKLDAFVQRRFFDVDPKIINVAARGKTVTITISAEPRILLDQSLQLKKLGVTHDIETYLKDKYSKVHFVEEWAIGSPA